MTGVDQGLGLVGHWIGWLFALVGVIFAAIEGALRQAMDQLHVAAPLQTVILLVLAVVLIIAAIRVFGGVLRLLIGVFLVLLLLHILLHGRM